MNFLVRLVGVAAAAASLVSCGGGGGYGGSGGSGGGSSGGGSGGGYGMTDPGMCSATFCFSASTFFPTSATVTKLETVSWVNNSGITHNVTFDNPSAAGAVGGGASGNIADHSSGTNSRMFSTAGTYPFHCSIHGFGGTLTVY